jgi:hypothetical protein
MLTHHLEKVLVEYNAMALFLASSDLLLHVLAVVFQGLADDESLIAK